MCLRLGIAKVACFVLSLMEFSAGYVHDGQKFEFG